MDGHVYYYNETDTSNITVSIMNNIKYMYRAWNKDWKVLGPCQHKMKFVDIY